MIKIGEYVRTRKGIIGRLRGQYIYGNGAEYPEPQEWVIDRFNNKRNYYVTNEADVDFDEIVKNSKNIIDLIEIGDFLEIVADDEPLRFEVDKMDYRHHLKNIAEDIKIKSIITKEQMENIEYIVED